VDKDAKWMLKCRNWERQAEDSGIEEEEEE
jgi:hypothetical protein